MKITSEIFYKKVTDYTFIVLFLLIFSIFIFFAIRPSLKTAFSLRKEEKDLVEIDSLYEKKIVSVSLIQSELEKNRNDLYLIDNALSKNPNVNKIIDDIKIAADKTNFFINKANVSDINLLQVKEKLGKVEVILEGYSSFPDLLSLIKEIHNQRRLKTIDNLQISKSKSGTDSSNLSIKINIVGYYL